jgi:hypothetical protein
LLPLAAPHHRREGLIRYRPSTRGPAKQGPLPAAVEAPPRMTYRQSSDAPILCACRRWGDGAPTPPASGWSTARWLTLPVRDRVRGVAVARLRRCLTRSGVPEASYWLPPQRCRMTIGRISAALGGAPFRHLRMLLDARGSGEHVDVERSTTRQRRRRYVERSAVPRLPPTAFRLYLGVCVRWQISNASPPSASSAQPSSRQASQHPHSAYALPPNLDRSSLGSSQRKSRAVDADAQPRRRAGDRG